MTGAARYGFLLGIAIVIFTNVAPQPAGSVVLFSALAVQLTFGAVLCWRRMRLPFATMAIAIGGVLFLCSAVFSATGRVFPGYAFALSGLSAPLLLLVESRVNRHKWKQWADYGAHKTVWDILVGRHMPRL